MKIKLLQISNILTFKYCEDISQATGITFDQNLNIIIGENGAGKSTALEVINFLFKRVLFSRFQFNPDLFDRRDAILDKDKKDVISAVNETSYSNFRLDPNCESEGKPQSIKLVVELDDIDLENLKNLESNKEKLAEISSKYAHDNTSNKKISDFNPKKKEYGFVVNLHNGNKTFSVQNSEDSSDPGYLYLINYNFYKDLIFVYNSDHPQNTIPLLYESFVLIGGYRNYHVFNPSVSLRDQLPSRQIRGITSGEFAKSLNAAEQSEPSIFNLVRLLVAEKHYDLFDSLSKEEAEKKANELEFLTKINDKLKLVNLKCGIWLVDKAKWEYAFKFFDTKRQKTLLDINSLSAGQKAIVHLIFESYGRGVLKGGLVIIDEPEIHLHYQFQNEYLQIIESLNEEQKCQYILVTHSESLINSKTINRVKRFSLDQNRQVVVKSPMISAEQKLLVKILDNTRSTHAFFGKKVVLVEGEDDRYFFRAAIQKLYPGSGCEVTILDIEGKAHYPKWKSFFESFGLKVYFISDLDYAWEFYPEEKSNIKKLRSKINNANKEILIKDFKSSHQDLEKIISEKYEDGIFVLKQGALEDYLGYHNKSLESVIKFCDESLDSYFSHQQTRKESEEIAFIIESVMK